MHYYFPKNKLIFALTLFCFLGFAGFVSAGVIELPNPLCPRDEFGNAGENCIDNFPDLILSIIEFVTTLVAALAVFMLVVAGIFFVISSGEPEKINTAKKIAIYAVVGLAIALMARGLIEVVQRVLTASA